MSRDLYTQRVLLPFLEQIIGIASPLQQRRVYLLTHHPLLEERLRAAGADVFASQSNAPGASGDLCVGFADGDHAAIPGMAGRFTVRFSASDTQEQLVRDVLGVDGAPAGAGDHQENRVLRDVLRFDSPDQCYQALIAERELDAALTSTQRERCRLRCAELLRTYTAVDDTVRLPASGRLWVEE